MRALVVGAGRMGTFHRKVLTDLGHDVTTVDPMPGRADYVTMPAHSFPVVCIASPIDTLAEQAAHWLGRCDWLLIEKPAAASLAEALALAGWLRGERVAVGYVERFNPRVQAAKLLLDGAVTSDALAPSSAHFTRWNDQPSDDPLLDLRSHDIDLARHLRLTCPVTYDTRAAVAVKRRTIELRGGLPHDVNLMAHTASPLHAQWRAFLSGDAGYATLADAVAVHHALAPPNEKQSPARRPRGDLFSRSIRPTDEYGVRRAGRAASYTDGPLRAAR